MHMPLPAALSRRHPHQQCFLFGDTCEERGANVINFGRKQKGKTFAMLMLQNATYLQWNLSRYASLMPKHEDFARYGQLWMKEVGNENQL